MLRIALWIMVIANLGRIPLIDSGQKEAPLLINDIVVVLLVVAGGVMAARRQHLVFSRTAKFALAFAATGGLSAAVATLKFGLSPFEFAFSLAYLLRWLTYFGIYLATINFVQLAEVPKVWRALEGMILLFAAFGIFQSILLPGFAQMVYPSAELFADWDPQGRRLVSTFLDPNYAGMLILIGLLVALARLSVGEPVDRWKLLILFTALVMTVSRSSALAFVAGGAVILMIRGLSTRLIKAGAVVALCAVPFIPAIIDFAKEYGKFTINASALSRVVSWIRAGEIFVDNPLIGVGFNTYGFIQRAYGFDATGNSSFGLDGGIIFIAVMTGAVGVALYSGMLMSVVKDCRSIWRAPVEDAPDESRGLAIGACACTIAIVVHSLFLNSLLYPFLMEPLWVLWGLVYVTTRVDADEEDDVPGREGLVAIHAPR